MKILENKIAAVKPLDERCRQEALMRWDKIAKPLKSLGRLEEIVADIAGMTRNVCVSVDKTALVIMCADNGVVEEGVTQTGQEVTAVVTENFTRGASCVCIMAEQAGADVYPVDIGVAALWDRERLGSRWPLIEKKVAYGTKNMAKEPAMTREEACAAIQVGVHMVEELKRNGYQMIATGEMGIGNTTTSSAVASVLLGKEAHEMTGKGAGLSDAGLSRKIRAVDWSVKLHKPNHEDAVDVLSKVGGLDLAGLTGVFLGGAVYQVPIVIDGFISAVAALAASVICPEATDYMVASHLSAEPAGMMVLDALGKKPLIQAGMCLGEGTGAVAALPLIQMAAHVYRQMSTFKEIHVDEYQPL